ncbi:MAG: DUF4274 domain-containing protein [Spirochaetales bacterium]|nr:DUF4274 domain-containing protein [Spirochaetales bacterium]
MTIKDFRQAEQDAITNLSEQCKVTVEKLINELIGKSIHSRFKEDVTTVVRDGAIQTLVLTPFFFKLKDFSAITQLPDLEELYISEGHQKSKENRVNKICIGKESKIHTLSIYAANLKELIIENEKITQLDLLCPELMLLEMRMWQRVTKLALSDSKLIDFNNYSIPWENLINLNIKNQDMSIPFQKLGNCQSIIIENYYNRGIEHFKGAKVTFKSDKLEEIKLWKTGIKSLNLKKCQKIKTLNVTEDNLSKLDFNPENIRKLDVFTGTKVVTLKKVRQCSLLEELRLRHVPDMNVSLALPHLKSICLFDINTITIDTVNCENLSNLTLHNGAVTHIKMKKGELTLDRIERLKDVDVRSSLMLDWFSYYPDQVKDVVLLCRESHPLFNKFIKKDFSDISFSESRKEDIEELFQHYNWDFGLEPVFWIINHKNCDKGTALKAYWYNCPGWYTQYKRQADIPKYEQKGAKLKKDIEKLYLSGFYETSDYSFNPAAEHVEMYADVQSLDKLPPEMLEPV